jgi:hypothetical protein
MRGFKGVGMLVFWFQFLQMSGQTISPSAQIKELRWGMNYQIYLYLTNDSSVVLNIQDLPHSEQDTSGNEQFTFLPVNLDNKYVDFLKSRNTDLLEENGTISDSVKVETLWRTVHDVLGGGWVHFINCITYSFESGLLDTEAPLLKRPVTSWKPNPPTESWKRTRKWNYYIPETQKLAQREYRATMAEGHGERFLGIPQEYIKLFLATNDATYKKLQKKHRNKDLAKINMVRLMVGAKYFGKAQLSYIRAQVLKSAMQFPARTLPSMILMDDFNAAVSMTLDETGYRIDKVFFRDEKQLQEAEREQRLEQINQEVRDINDRNRKVYEKMLKDYFH